MRIGIDGLNLAIPNGTGVATYAFMLARNLRSMGVAVDGMFGIDPGPNPKLYQAVFLNCFASTRPLSRWRLRDARLLMGRPRAQQIETDGFTDRRDLEERLPAFDRLFTVARLFERARMHFRMVGRMLTLEVPDPPSIMHWTYPVPVRLAGAKNIYTLHDLVPLRLPYTTLDQKDYYRALISECVRRSDRLCTVSDAVRDDVIERFAVEPAKIVNTYQVSGLADVAHEEDHVVAARIIASDYGLKQGHYFLYVGAIEPKKNVGRIVEAYLSLATETPLVLVGGRSWLAEAELSLISRQSTDRVRRLDFLPRRDLVRLMRNARALVFPSLYEGFGLPVHEAMLLGVPVLTSAAGGLSEVAGTAALQVDPYSVDAIADGLARLDRDAALRADLSLRGRAHALRFSPEAYRKRLAGLYADFTPSE